MAVEVDAGKYLNKPYLQQADRNFSHNPLHDIESLWWVGVWFLLCHYHPGNLRRITVQQHFEVVKTYGETLFNNSANPNSRRQALTSQDLLENIVPETFPTSVQHLILLLDLFREQLVAQYELYEPKVSQDQSFFIPDLHREFGGIVEEAMTELSRKADKTGLWLIGDVEKQIVYYNAKK